MNANFTSSLAHRFALAASALAGCTMLLTMLASFWLVNQQQVQADAILLQKEALHNTRLLNSTIKAITTRLNESASSSLVANALVDSAGRQTYLTPYLNGMQAINGIPINVILVDFEGKEIASSNHAHVSAAQVTWLRQQLDQGKAEAAIFHEASGDQMILTELLTYSRTNSAEGALVYMVAMADLQALVSAQLRWGPALAGEVGKLQMPLETSPSMKKLQLRILQNQVPEYAGNKRIFFTLIAAFSLVLGAIVLFIGLRLAPSLTRDLRELEEFSRSVVETGFGALRARVQGSKEVAGLASSINHMLDRLHEQHAQLQAESEARYRLLVEGTNAISWEATLPEFQYTFVSPQGQSITAFAASQWYASGFWQGQIHQDDVQAVLELRQQSILAKQDYTCEYRFQRKDGSYVWLEEIAAVLIDEHGLPQSFRGILLDVDERKLAEAKLQAERSKVDRLKNDFVSTVSHELRTPLTSIRGALGLVLGGVSGAIPKPAEKLLSIAHQNSERLVNLINDLLDIDKIISGKMEFEWQWLDLLPIVEQAIETNQAYASQFGVSLVLTEKFTPPQVKIDVNRLLQVLANLISNAAKFSPAGGTVEVSMVKIPGFVRVAVQDHGNGISKEFRTKIFEKFSQQDSSSTRAKGGTGLGLAISKVLIEQMGGRIDFESEEGKGTCFYFDLPV